MASVLAQPSPAYPASLLPSLRGVPLVCPLCRGSLEVGEEAYGCSPCGRSYPLHGGIPDFRIFPDPYLDYEEDRRRTEYVLAGLERFDLAGLLDYYWRASDITPPALRAKFIRSALLGERRAARVLRVLEDGTFERPIAAGRVLDIGSGTGNFLAVALRHGQQVVGIDIAMRWLHLSRRRFLDAGLPVPPLVCCCAEHLPFPDGWFDLAVCCSTLEFTQDQPRVLAEGARVLAGRGALFLDTVNRFSLAQNPYAYLWGVGFLPRAWQARYVRWRRQASYEHVRLLSLGELRRLAGTHFGQMEVALPDLDDDSLRQLSWTTRLQVGLYRRLKKLPVTRQLLRWVGPQWDVKLSGPRPGGQPRD